MVIEIRRRWLSISLSDGQEDYEAVVWRQEGPPFTTPQLRAPAPAGFAPGLLSVYIDGQPSTLETLWAVIGTASS